MLYINTKERESLSSFRSKIYNYLKQNKLRYSDQREKVLKVLHEQSYPVSIEYLVSRLNEDAKSVGYATVSRHIKFFEKLDMLIVVNKIPKGYLLKKDVDCDDIEVLSL
jgi:Fe2+ or Zn2+ uptake regulation protein